MSYHHKSKRDEVLTKIDNNATVNRAGQKINWKKYTQEQNVELDIYDVLEKYDGKYRNRLKYDPEIELAEIDHTMTLEKVFDRNKAIKQQWLNLPLEVRNEFNNDVNTFVDKGQAWLENKVKETQKKQKEEQEKLKKVQEQSSKIINENMQIKEKE